MNIPHSIAHLKKLARVNSPEILIGVGVVGVVSTAYLAAKGAVAARRAKDEAEYLPGDMTKVETLKVVWPYYVPAAISGALTISAIVTSSRISGKRAMAAAAAYSLLDQASGEIEEKIKEELGDGKLQKIKDAVAGDKANRAVEANGGLGEIPEGKIKVVEAYTGRLFTSDRNTIDRAVNQINHTVVRDGYATLDEFYYQIGLHSTTVSSSLGWDGNHGLMELEYSTAAVDHGEVPVLVFEYRNIRSV